jgi:integrase/recombinase XerD
MLPPRLHRSTSPSRCTAFATHLLEQKVDIRVIQVLLGHKKLETTALYTQVGTEILREVVSPIEVLPAP